MCGTHLLHFFDILCKLERKTCDTDETKISIPRRLLPRPWGSQNGMHDDTGRHKRLASGEDKNIWNTFLAPEQHCICNQRKRLSPCRSVQKRFFLFFYNNEFSGCWLSSKAEKSVFNLLVSHFMDVRSYCLGAFRGFLTAKKRYWKTFLYQDIMYLLWNFPLRSRLIWS